jgi:hypothetical protein
MHVLSAAAASSKDQAMSDSACKAKAQYASGKVRMRDLVAHRHCPLDLKRAGRAVR